MSDPRRDLRGPDHRPHRRPDGEPPEPSWLPRQRVGTSPQMIGRYPDYDVLANEANWDSATRAVVGARLGERPPMAFFAESERPTLRALCDVALAQNAEPRVPVAEMVDEKLAGGRLDGCRYADMPKDPDTWRQVLRGLDESARARFGADSFAACTTADQEMIFSAFAAGSLHGREWDQLNVSRAFSVCMRAILAAFYSHPWAWNEIGYGGPAYPQGYMRMGPLAVREPHERPGATAEDPVREVKEADG
jgi:hypothetical protein